MGLWDLALIPAAALISAALIVLLRPLFMRYALARPNARSSHAVPTPQGGGAAVVAAVLVTLALAGILGTEARSALGGLMPLAAGVVMLTLMGAVDDIFAIAATPRLALQALAVTAVVATLPADLRAVPVLPLAIERAAE